MSAIYHARRFVLSWPVREAPPPSRARSAEMIRRDLLAVLNLLALFPRPAKAADSSSTASPSNGGANPLVGRGDRYFGAQHASRSAAIATNGMAATLQPLASMV